MDCRNFKELLDSYLCEELAVETNHAVLRHVEQCSSCRSEMVSRRLLRQTLRRACSQEVMSDEAMGRLRARLRAEGQPERPSRGTKSGRGWFAGVFASRIVLPVAATVALALLFGSLWVFNLLRRDARPKVEIAASVLSDALMEEASGDHLTCARKFIVRTSATKKMPEWVRDIDPAYVDLDSAAEAGAISAGGLQLRSSHVCGFKGRRFAHLVYLRSPKLISLLVTERDIWALGTANLPDDDGSQAGMQKAIRDSLALGAYQTKKHVVLVVSDLSEAENVALAEQLATPVATHLRRVEGGRSDKIGGATIYRNKEYFWNPALYSGLGVRCTSIEEEETWFQLH